MRCPHCGHTFEPNATAPGDWFACPACGKGFAAPRTVLPQPPQAGGHPLAKAAGWGSTVVWILAALVCGGCVVFLLLPFHSKAREPANRMSCGNNLKQIGLALYNYHDTYNALPAQAVLDESGRPMHSWRTAILPFIEERDLYESYDFDRPWDSPENLVVGEAIVSTYGCRSREDYGESNETSYFVVYGDATMFAPNRWIKFSDVADGLSNTIMVVESNSLHVPWSQPVDIPLEEIEFLINPPDGPGVSSPHPSGGANVAMGDASVRFVPDSLEPRTFRYALIRCDGVDDPLP